MKRRFRKSIGILLSVLMTMTMIPILPVMAAETVDDQPTATNPFQDVQEADWFYDAVQYVNEHGLMNGTARDIFEPQTTMSRAMTVTVLHRIEKEPSAEPATFKDVPAGAWFTNAVAWAAADGIVKGYNADTFGPNDNVTREQIATILFRYAEKKGYDVSKRGDLSSYADDADISDWAKDAMAWANAAGLIVGRDGNKLAPKANITRAEDATVLKRLCENIVEPGEEPGDEPGDQPGDNPGDQPGDEKATFTVTFDYNYDNRGTYKTVEVKDGEKAETVADPTRSGYTFSGWYTEASNGTKFDANKAVTENMKLYAHWTKKSSGGSSGGSSSGGGTPAVTTYTVTFDTNGGSSVDSQKVKENQKATEPTAPTKENNTFAGWYSDSELTTEYNFDTAVTKNITLYAKWEEDQPAEPGVITDSWEEIIASTEDGTYKTKYNIGDTKELDLGSEGIVDMQIVAFDADELADGSGTAAITWISKQLLKSDHRMNPDRENDSSDSSKYKLGTGSIGGWEQSEMRTWLNDTIKSMIPTTVQTAIKPVKKYSTSYDVSGNWIKDSETIDEVWIPSIRELYNADWSESVGPRYSEIDRIKYKDGTSTPSVWWMRSAFSYSTNNFMTVGEDGHNYIAANIQELPVALGFCIGATTAEQSPVEYTVTFNTNGGSAVDSQKVKENQKAKEPTAPTKENNTFVGWYSDSELTTEYNFDTAVTENMTLYAKWEEGKASGGGGSVAPITDENLTLTNLSTKYEPGADDINEDSLGWQWIYGTVTGPSNVCEVRIAWWDSQLPTEEKAKENNDRMISIWKEEGSDIHGSDTPPFPLDHCRPVYDGDPGTKQYVTLVGLDSQMNYVGYAVVAIDIGSSTIEIVS